MQRFSWKLHQDPLHVANFLAVLFAYSYVVEPLLLGDALSTWIQEPNDRVLVGLFYLGCVSAFAIGLSNRFRESPSTRLGDSMSIPRHQIQGIAFALAIIALVIFVYGLQNAGGLVAAYSKAKGGGRFRTGYLGEATNLGLLAVLFIALSRRRMGLSFENWIVIFIGLTPTLVQGTLGGRRGPLFISLGALLATIVITAKKQLSMRTIFASFVLICVTVVFVWSQRQNLYLGSESSEINWQQFTDNLFVQKADQGNNYIYGAGFILTAWHTGEYTYGAESATNLLIRPIPKQLWPQKYADVGATWISEQEPGMGIYSTQQWQDATGWVPYAGSSSNSASDLFGEFSWLAIFVYYLLGRGMIKLYHMHRESGEIWTVIYLASLPLTIYLATQSFSAFYHRFLVFAIPAMLIWWIYGRPRSLGRQQSKLKEQLN
jgi:hypothetical protein